MSSLGAGFFSVVHHRLWVRRRHSGACPEPRFSNSVKDQVKLCQRRAGVSCRCHYISVQILWYVDERKKALLK